MSFWKTAILSIGLPFRQRPLYLGLKVFWFFRCDKSFLGLRNKLASWQRCVNFPLEKTKIFFCKCNFQTYSLHLYSFVQSRICAFLYTPFFRNFLKIQRTCCEKQIKTSKKLLVYIDLIQHGLFLCLAFLFMHTMCLFCTL